MKEEVLYKEFEEFEDDLITQRCLIAIFFNSNLCSLLLGPLSHLFDQIIFKFFSDIVSMITYLGSGRPQAVIGISSE